MATEFEVHAATDTTLQVRMRGVPVAEAPWRIEAATLHGLTVAPSADGLEAEVVLDVVACPSSGELAEEAPFAYKDVDRVVDVVHRAGLARKVARRRPIGVVTG